MRRLVGQEIILSTWQPFKVAVIIICGTGCHRIFFLHKLFDKLHQMRPKSAIVCYVRSDPFLAERSITTLNG
jgi:hypothetical protein